MLVHTFNRSFVMVLIVFAVWTHVNADNGCYAPTDRLSPVVYISASLFTAHRSLLMDVRCGNIFRSKPNGSLSASVVALMLLISGVESNPGPSVFVGSLNARSIVQKGPLIQDLIMSHRLDALAVCESWIVRDDSHAVKFDAVSPGFRVLHVSRSTATRRVTGG